MASGSRTEFFVGNKQIHTYRHVTCPTCNGSGKRVEVPAFGQGRTKERKCPNRLCKGGKQRLWLPLVRYR